MPGGIDVHTHLHWSLGNRRTNDDFRSGTISAALGGTTTIIDFTVQREGMSALDVIDERREEAERAAVIDYGFHYCLTGMIEKTFDELETIVKYGISSFKVFMCNAEVLVNDGFLYTLMKSMKKLGCLLMIHAENDAIITYLVKQAIKRNQVSTEYFPLTSPKIAEVEAISRAILFAKILGTSIYFVHVSTNEGVKVIEDAQKDGFKIFAETCPHYLFLTDDLYAQPHGLKYVMTPPLRKETDKKALWNGIKKGIVSVVSSDHLALGLSSKLMATNFIEVPKGVAGIETRVPVLFSAVSQRVIDIRRFAEVTSANPAKLFGLYPQKGAITIGSDADLVVIDPKRKVTLSSKNLHMGVDYSVFENMQIIGYPIITISRGEIIVENSKFMGKTGRGEFLERGIANDLDERNEICQSSGGSG